MTAAMKTYGYIAAMAATLLFTGCFHENHELASLSGGEGLLALRRSGRWRRTPERRSTRFL